jgi:aminoglycoside phosphotransferase family enzyme/predicted kinase
MARRVAGVTRETTRSAAVSGAAMSGDDQSAIVRFLSNPANHQGQPGPVERIETHAAIVFLAGDRAYKVKRAVRYDYLDFSTLERRRAACEAELRLNRRTAPALYLGVMSIARGDDGGLRWGASGVIVEWMLVMRRFPQEALFDRRASANSLELAWMPALAEAIARLHEGAERTSTHGGRQGMGWVIEGNAQSFAAYGATLPADASHAVTVACRHALDGHADLLDARRLGGFVRRCHGDLHLRNIVLFDGKPTLFDAVEFNDEISCVDVLYDFAFLVMDLLRRGLGRHANRVFNHYLEERADLAGLPLFPLFLACRAAIRAKTSATAATLQTDRSRAAELEVMARDYLAMAEQFLRPAGPLLVAIGGFSGTGKSTLATGLAPGLGRAPGALILRSDLIRKSLFGVPAQMRLGPEGYTADISRSVYSRLTHAAASALAGGQAVIADAVFADSAARTAIADVARGHGVPFVGLWLEADPDTLRDRVDTRHDDASDATRTVLDGQLQAGAGDVSWHRLSGGGNAAETEHAAAHVLKVQGLLKATDTPR